MTTGMVHDQNLEKQMEKQMGCMAGFLQLFDRHQMGKRLYTTKRLPPPTIVNASPESEMYVDSPAISKEPEKPRATRSMTSPSPDRYKPSQSAELLRSLASVAVPSVEMLPKSPLPLPIFELNEGSRYSWKFCKETPRLSLDSRATFDSAKGSLYPKEIRTNASTLSGNRCDNSGGGADDKNHRSPSVIARLMGLEPLPNSSSTPEPKQVELRRSASESRVSRDIFQYRSTEHNNSSNNFQVKQQNQLHFARNNITGNVIRERNVDPMDYSSKNSRSELPRASNRGFKSPQQRKGFFDSADFFPEPKQTVSIYGEIERRLKMRGIDEPSKDLETLKQILEAMQLKGLLHSKKPSSQIRNKNFVFDRNYSSDVQSPIVLMKPFNRRLGDESPPSNFRSKSGVRGNESISSVNPRREGATTDRNVNSPTRAKNASSPTRNESTMKKSNSNSLVRKKQLTIETQKRVNEYTENRRVSPINSPRISPKRDVSDQTATNRSPRNRKPTAQIYAKEKITNTVVIEDESSSSISESTVSTPSQSTDSERFKTEVEFKGGRRLLDRCDKLLHSIAEMNAAELQPSPVSVLDSSFYKDESSSSPSPVMKRSISFTDESVELEEDLGSPGIFSSMRSSCEDENGDSDFVYISEILRALSSYASEEAADDIFLLLEQYLKGKDTSKVSRLGRKLVFDTITEILDRKRQLPTWKAFAKYTAKPPSLREIWSEFRKIRERETSDDLFEIVCGVLKKDLAGDATKDWVDCPVEMSEAVLDIERLIFKDLVGESIRDLAEFAWKSTFLAPRRKLVF